MLSSVLDYPHAGFVLAAYIAAAMVVGGLIVRAVVDDRLQRRALDDLAARGLDRRPVPSSGHSRQAGARSDKLGATDEVRSGVVAGPTRSKPGDGRGG
jgi:heme exporter protein D